MLTGGELEKTVRQAILMINGLKLHDRRSIIIKWVKQNMVSTMYKLT